MRLVSVLTGHQSAARAGGKIGGAETERFSCFRTRSGALCGSGYLPNQEHCAGRAIPRQAVSLWMKAIFRSVWVVARAGRPPVYVYGAGWGPARRSARSHGFFRWKSL